jgi:hypothetical protein
MQPSTTRPRERGTCLRFAIYASHVPQPNRSVGFLVFQLCFHLLMLVSLAIVMLNMGGPSKVCPLASRFHSVVTTNRPPGLRNPRVSEEPIFRRGPHSSPFSIPFGSVDCQKTDSPDREAVCRHWRWVSHSALDRNAGRRLGGVTGRAPPGDGTSQELRRVPLCASPGGRDRKAYERGWRKTRNSVHAIPSIQL